MPRQSRQYAYPGTGVFDKPYASMAGVDSSAYDNAYQNAGNFGTKHPVLTGLAGALFLGPAGLGLPMRAKMAEQQKQAAISAAYEAAIKQGLENQLSADKINAPRQGSNYTRQLQQAMQAAGQVNPNTPLVEQDSVLDPAFLKEVLSGTSNAGSLGIMDNLINNQQGQSFNLPGNRQAPQGQPMPLTPQQPNPNISPNLPQLEQDPYLSQQGVFQTSARQQNKSLANPYDPTQLPIYMSDATFGNLQNAQTAAATNALTTGQNAYQFEQEAPNRQAEIASQQALAALRGAQTKTEGYRPGLIQAETRYKNEQYRGGPAPQGFNMNEAVWGSATPGQRQAIINKAGAAGSGAAPNSAVLEQLQELGADAESARKGGLWGLGADESKAMEKQALYNAVAKQYNLPLIGQPQAKATGKGVAAKAQERNKRAAGFTTRSGVSVQGL